MKKGKIFALTSVLVALGLVACGGKTSKEPAAESKEPAVSQEAGTSSQAPNSQEAGSSSQATSSQAPAEKAVTVASFGLSKKTDNKVYMTATGTATGFAANELKFALALQHTNDVTGGDGKTGYAVGGAEFADADYSIVPTMGAENAFSIEYNLSDIQNIGGSYFLTLGVKGVAEIATPTTHDDVELVDSTYRFYYRNDISNRLTLHADEVPPLSLTSATIVKDADNGKLYAKIGGAAKAGLTQAELNEYDTFIQFQQVGGSWTKTRLSKADGQFRWAIEGANAFLYADIDWWSANQNYNTHLNVKYGSEANCKMEVNIDEHYNVQKSNGTWVDIEVFSDLTASGSDQSKFWGNLGFRVTAGVEPGVHVHNPVEVETKANSNEKNVTLNKCADDNFYRITMNAQEGKLNGQLDSNTAGKLKKGSSFDFEINLNTTADLTNVQLIMGRSDSHYERHLFNEAIWNRDHDADHQVTLPGQNPDSVDEDEWRYTITVTNGGTTTEFPITNMQTAKELNGGENPASKPFYFPFCALTLKNGTNVINIKRNNIGYANVFSGELRLEFETTQTISLANAPAVQ